MAKLMTSERAHEIELDQMMSKSSHEKYALNPKQRHRLKMAILSHPGRNHAPDNSAFITITQQARKWQG